MSIVQYQALRVAFVPGGTGNPRWLSTSRSYRFPQFNTFPEAKKVAIGWIKEAQAGIPPLQLGEAYLVMVRKIVVQKSVNVVWAWSPAAGGVIPRASHSQLDKMLNPSVSSSPRNPNPQPVLSDLGVASGRYIFQLHSGNLPSNRFSEYFRRDVRRAFEHTGRLPRSDFEASGGTTVNGLEQAAGTYATGGSSFYTLPPAKGYRGEEPDPTKTTSVNVADLQKWLLALGAPPTGLVRRDGTPDGQWGPRTKAAFEAQASEFEQDRTIASAATGARTVQIAPASIVTRIQNEAAKVKPYAARIVKDSGVTIIDPNGIPAVTNETLGWLAKGAYQSAKQAGTYATRIDKIDRSDITDDLISVYDEWFKNAQALQRLFAIRLTSSRLAPSVQKVAESQGYIGEDVVNQIGMRRLPAANVLTYTPNLLPLPKFTELGWAALAIPIARILGMTAVSIAGAWGVSTTAAEARRMYDAKKSKEKLDAVLAGIEKPYKPSDVPSIVDPTKPPEEPEPGPLFGLDTTTLVSILAIGGLGVVLYMNRDKVSSYADRQRHSPAMAGFGKVRYQKRRKKKRRKRRKGK